MGSLVFIFRNVWRLSSQTAMRHAANLRALRIRQTLSRNSAYSLFLILALVLAAAPGRAQGPSGTPPPTNVFGTILDPTGVPYNTGYIRFDLVPSGGPIPCVGNPCSPINGHYGNVYLDGNGHFQMNLWANSLVTPANTQWQITVSEPGNPAPWCFGPQSFTAAFTIPNQASYDMSAQLSALAPQLCRNGGGTNSIEIEHNGTPVGTRPIVNINDNGSVVFTVTDDSVNNRVNFEATAAGGGSGCVLPAGGVLFGILGENPKGTCDDSAKATWDKDDALLQIGDGTNTVVQSPGDELNRIFAFGRNISVTSADDLGFGLFDIFLNGNKIVVTESGAEADLGYIAVLGASQTIDGSRIAATNGGGVFTVVCLMDGCMDFGPRRGIWADGAGSAVNVVLNAGSNNQVKALTAANNSSAFIIGEEVNFLAQDNCDMSDNFNFGENNTVTCETAAAAAPAHNTLLGNFHTVDTSTHQLFNAFLLGDTLSVSNSSGADMDDIGLFGTALTAANCSHCYGIGENISISTSNLMMLGMTSAGSLSFAGTSGNVRRIPVTFSVLPACAAGTEGSFAAITDSSTNVWGATITGSSTNHVLGYCDGTNWTVAGK